MNNTQKIYEGGEWEFILEHPIKISDVIRGSYNGKLIVRILKEEVEGTERLIFLIQRKDTQRSGEDNL